MIGISKLYCGTVEPSDPLRYGRKSSRLPSHLLQFSADRKPVIVWNATRACNLQCVHCYASCDGRPADDELSTAEAEAMIDDLASFGSPVLLVSGGEPLRRPDVFDLLARARDGGMRVVLSSNGTLLTPQAAEQLKTIGLSYIGVSLDGATPETNDAFRGQAGAYDRAMAGIRIARDAGLKVGLRFTITRDNIHEVPALLDLLEREGLPRICLYHLVTAGRGETIRDILPPAEQTREVLLRIMRRTRQLHDADRPVEVLTVDNHADGPFVYLQLLREDPERAERVRELLEMNGGNRSGVGIGCVSWDGRVHPDQFWRSRVVGNVRERPFSAIWTDPSQPLLSALRDRHPHLDCRCLRCRFLPMCNGNLRARADSAGNGPWGDDPGCYLTDEEIAP